MIIGLYKRKIKGLKNKKQNSMEQQLKKEASLMNKG